MLHAARRSPVCSAAAPVLDAAPPRAQPAPREDPLRGPSEPALPSLQEHKVGIEENTFTAPYENAYENDDDDDDDEGGSATSIPACRSSCCRVKVRNPGR